MTEPKKARRIKLDEAQVESLRAWARERAPHVAPNDPWPSGDRRAIRLEISMELFHKYAGGNRTGQMGERVMATVYLAEPRCYGHGTKHDVSCECGPLAEKRIG